MNIKNALALSLLLAVSLTAFAANPAPSIPDKISNEDADALFGALSSVKDGLSPANIGPAAEDIWILKGLAEEFTKQDTKRQISLTRAQSSKDIASAQESAVADWDKFRLSEVPIKLVPLIPFTDQELKDAHITPALLSPIQHYLFPSKL